MRLASLDDVPSDSKIESVSDRAFPSLLKNPRLRSVSLIVLDRASWDEDFRLERIFALMLLNMMAEYNLFYRDQNDVEVRMRELWVRIRM